MHFPLARSRPGPARRVRAARRRTVVPLALAFASLSVVTARGDAQTVSPRRVSLGDVVRIAAGQNPAVGSAHARAAQATARVRQRRADLYPALFATAAEAGRTFNTATLGFAFKGPDGSSFFDPNGEVLGPVLSTDLRAHISQSILDPGALARLDAARSAATAASTEADVASEQAAAVAATAYVRLLRADAQLRARRADSTLAADLLNIADEQLRAGVGVALDVTRARSQVAQVKAQLVAARLERDRAGVELTRVLGIAADERLEAADSLAGLALSVDTVQDPTLGARAADQRPDVRTLDAQLTTATRQERAIRRERLPIVAAFGDRGPIAGDGTPFLSTYNWGVQLTVPIFNGFRTDARLQEQEAVRHELEMRRRDLARQVALDVRAAQDELGAAREQLEAANERASLAGQELAQARERFRAGVSGNADVITASLSLNAARTLVIDALTGWHLARVALARSLGDARDLR